MRLAGQATGRPAIPAAIRRAPPAPTRPGAEAGAGPPSMPPRRTWLWLLLVLAVNFWLARLPMPGPEAPIPVPYTLFKEEVGEGERRSDLQPRRHPHGPLQDRSHLSAAPSGDRSAQGRPGG